MAGPNDHPYPTCASKCSGANTLAPFKRLNQCYKREMNARDGSHLVYKTGQRSSAARGKLLATKVGDHPPPPAAWSSVVTPRIGGYEHGILTLGFLVVLSQDIMYNIQMFDIDSQDLLHRNWFKGQVASISSKSATKLFSDYWWSSSSKSNPFHLDWHQYAHILCNLSRVGRKTLPQWSFSP